LGVVHDALFPPSRDAALARLAEVNVSTYARTRNHLRGAVTRLSPYLTHGLLSVPEVVAATPGLGNKLHQELGWREFFALVHAREGAGILRDRFGPQPRLRATDSGDEPGSNAVRLPRAIAEGRTGIDAIDDAVRALVREGYVHNHARMWLAAVVCHVAGVDWRVGARWFFYHLLDGDLASNALSWQWVAGTGSAKPYLADQANLNRFADTNQRGTFLDQPHAALLQEPIPDVLQDMVSVALPMVWPEATPAEPDPALPLLLYHPWGLDPTWRAAERAERRLLIEPVFFERHPISPKRLQWILAAASTIPGLQVMVANARDVVRQRMRAHPKAAPIRFRAHPAVAHWPGAFDPIPTAFAHRWRGSAAPRSFSAFWKSVGG
jgi:deoxyribodipyrimidine photo-lyase